MSHALYRDGKPLAARPRLLLHPGFPKCATTTVQHQLMQQDFRLVRDMGWTWLGQGLRPFDGLPPVLDIGYRAEQIAADLSARAFRPDRTYLLTAESILTARWLWPLLRERFEVLRVLCTVRMPLLQALSDYCYSGWLRRTPEQWAGNSGGALLLRLSRMKDQLRDMTAALQAGPASLCPIEPAGLMRRVLTGLAGPDARVPDLPTVRRNVGISPLLAAHLSRAVEGIEALLARPEQRRILLHAAQRAANHRGVTATMPAAFAHILRDAPRMVREVGEYREWLLGAGVPHRLVRETVVLCADRIAALAAMPLPDAQTEAIAAALVRRIIDGVRDRLEALA